MLTKNVLKRVVCSTICLYVLSCMTATGAWALTGDEILKKALNLREGIKDYTAQVAVTTDFEDVDIPDRQITLYYKAPDKVHVDSDGVVFIPKRVVNLHSLGSEIAKDSRVMLLGKKTVSGRLLYSVKVLAPERDPNTDAPANRQYKNGPAAVDNQRLLIWVWGDNWTVQKMQMYRGSNQLFEVRWTHQKIAGRYWMPQWIIFAASSGQLPHGGKGEVRMHFKQIKVNTGLKDSLFDQDTERRQ